MAFEAEEEEFMYSREWLLSVREMVPRADDDQVLLRSLYVTPDASPCSGYGDSPKFGSVEGSEDKLSPPKVRPPTAAPAVSKPSVLSPAEKTAMQELLLARLHKDITEATALAVASTDETHRVGWGKGNDPSQLLNRIRRAPGRSVPLATLFAEAPLDWKILKDGEAFATWLRHRTGLLEVKGLPGDEYVTWAGSAKDGEKSDFAFNPKATEFNPWSYEECFDSEYMTVEEAAMMYYGEGPDGMDYDMGEGLDFALPGELGDSFGALDEGNQDMDLSAIGPPPGLSEEEDPPAIEVSSLTTGALNPKAAEFHPNTFLAEYDKACKVGPKSHKAKSSRRNLSRPDAIPEEPITGSSETASGGEDPAMAYEESTSGDDEEALAAKVALALASQSSTGP